MTFSPAGSMLSATRSAAADRDSLIVFLWLPAVAMSLGWGLRGTIGGGFWGAMIPGTIVTLCLCHLLGWKSSLGIVAAFGAVGVGIGGQETYGETIGLVRDGKGLLPDTMLRGLLGLTIKGAMWGLSGGVLVGLGFMHAKYRWREIAVGLVLMLSATYLGWKFVDSEERAYFSKTRAEVWVGLTLGASALVTYLFALRRETTAAWFALGGMLAGGAGFGGGGLWFVVGATLPEPYRGGEWWKCMEFTFGALYGLGLGLVAYQLRDTLRAVDDWMAGLKPFDLLSKVPWVLMVGVGTALAMLGTSLSFPLPILSRATMSVLAGGLILLSLLSNRLAWHVALSMTICAFFRDFLRGGVERHWFALESEDFWKYTLLMILPVVTLVTLSEWKGRLTPAAAILGLAWLATPFGMAKTTNSPFVFLMFMLELLITTILILAIPLRSQRNTITSSAAAERQK
jgi:uncharacterized membrane protein YqjE